MYFYWKLTSNSDPRISFKGSSSVLASGASINIVAKTALDKNGFNEFTEVSCDIAIGNVFVRSEDEFIPRFMPG